MLHFNQYGLLSGGPIIRSTLAECKKEFVKNIPTPERKMHFNAYLEYSAQLKMLCGEIEMKQWINGSFVTKKARPADIDLVTFIDHEITAAIGQKIKAFIYPQSEENFKVDAYIVTTYPQESNRFFLYKSNSAYWMNQFGNTRRNKMGKKRQKGFLEIVY